MNGGLVIRDVHDFAAIYVNGQLVDTRDRRYAAPDGSLPPVQVNTSGPAQLDILVANDGRVNVDHTMRTETKGITQLVALGGRPLADWRVFLLPMTSPPDFSTRSSARAAVIAPVSQSQARPAQPTTPMNYQRLQPKRCTISSLRRSQSSPRCPRFQFPQRTAQSGRAASCQYAHFSRQPTFMLASL